MKKDVIKTTVAAVCVVAAGMGGFKAYNAAAQSETDMLLAENVEALSQNESGQYTGSWCYLKCYSGKPEETCTVQKPSGGEETCSNYKDKNADIKPGDQSDYDDSNDLDPDNDWGPNPADDDE